MPLVSTEPVGRFGKDRLPMNSKDRDPVFWRLGPTQIPIVAANFFESILIRQFVEVLGLLLAHENVGLSEGILQCMFEKNFDPIEYELDSTDVYNHPFQGVRFSLRISWKDPLEYVIVNESTFMDYVREACEKFLQQHPHYKDEIVGVFRSNGLTY